MLALAVAAVLQALWKGPVGSGYLYPSVISAVYLPPRADGDQVVVLPAVAGGAR